MAANLVRWGGLAAMLAGVLVIPIMWLAVLMESLFYLMILVMLLLVVALPGLQARQAAQSGLLGRVSFVVALLSACAVALLAAFVGVAEAFFGFNPEDSVLSPLAFILFIAFMVGITLFGIATFRAGVLPRLAGVLLALAFPTGIVIDLVTGAFSSEEAMPWGFLLGFTIFGISFIWLGYAAWSEREKHRWGSPRVYDNFPVHTE